MMMLKKLVPLSCIVAAALGGCMAPSAPPDSLSGVVFEETFKTPEAAAQVSGAEFIPGGGPDGQNSIRIKGGDRPAEMKLDASKLRGRLVTVEAMVKGQDLSGTLQIVPDYIQGPGEYYPSRGGDKGSYDWRKFAYSVQIPDYAGDLKLRFGHAGKSGVAEYADVKLTLVPVPSPCTYINEQPLQKTPQYRGAMVGSLRGDNDAIRIFGEKWHGNLVRYQFGGGGDANTPEKYRKWGEARMADLDRLLPEFEKYGIKVVIDLHSGPATMNEILQNVGIWTTEAQDMIVDLWREIARHYKGNSNIYGYDILNEPHSRNLRPGDPTWPELAERTIKAIRAIDPVTPIIVEPDQMAHYELLEYLPVFEEPNIIYSIHFYAPGQLTHQLDPKVKPILGYPDETRGWNREYLRKNLEKAREFQQKTGARAMTPRWVKIQASVWPEWRSSSRN